MIRRAICAALLWAAARVMTKYEAKVITSLLHSFAGLDRQYKLGRTWGVIAVPWSLGDESDGRHSLAMYDVMADAARAYRASAEE